MDNYWVGTYGIRVPLNINSIPYSDGNTMYRNGRITEVYCMDVNGNPLNINKDDYLNKYGEKRSDGFWYWKC